MKKPDFTKKEIQLHVKDHNDLGDIYIVCRKGHYEVWINLVDLGGDEWEHYGSRIATLSEAVLTVSEILKTNAENEFYDDIGLIRTILKQGAL